MTTFQSASTDARSEYIPNGAEQHTNGNGNGHGKIFSLKPATDPDTYKILDARRDCLKDSRINRSCKAFFCEVLDRALNPSFFEAKGILVMSDRFFAEEVFGVSLRTIYAWKRAVAAAGYFWLAEQFRTNMWPITKYYISALHRQRQEQRTDRDGTYSTGGRFRPKPANPGSGAREPGQPGLPLPGSRATHREPENAENQGISAESGKNLPVSAETDCGSEPKNSSGESRNGLRLRAETDCGSEPKNSSGESRNGLRVTPEANFGLIESQVRDSVPKESRGGDSPPDLAFEKWIKTLDTAFPSHLEKLKAEFKRQMNKLKSEAARKALERKIAAVNDRLYGPPPPKDESTGCEPSAPAIIHKIATRQPTAEEIEEGKRFMAERAKRSGGKVPA